MNLSQFLAALESDLKKIFAFAPVVAMIDPQAAGGIAEAQAIIAALQPTIAAVQSVAGGGLNHADLVTGVVNAITTTSTALTAQGVMTGTTNQHVQALAPLVSAAVALSGIAVPATA